MVGRVPGAPHPLRVAAQSLAVGLRMMGSFGVGRGMPWPIGAGTPRIWGFVPLPSADRRREMRGTR
ncbi:hypothetical protein FRAAL1175 [Frankia alni ACN14a]|uniref:Uncharacterized protein n=1 Tax=Frankia alni (strain DSM 45986 / CECT 9034 / ACN14a) TaxID=326424 RepID=Q0RRI2_FRAAA|nr:hypothetical protein FRAAL1175 [Frankia alni ACN14a]